MESSVQLREPVKFSSPEEELRYLRERVAAIEQQKFTEGQPVHKEAIISNEVITYSQESPREKLAEHFILENPKFEESVNLLNSLPHREKMRELYHVLAEHGILNAIRVARELKSPHLEDDFHGVLIHYVKTGAVVPGLDKEKALTKTLKKTLYEVTLPHAAGEETPGVAAAVQAMERFFSGMLPGDREHAAGHDGFTLELAMPNFTSDIIFYVAVKDELRGRFEQQLFGSFPAAKIEVVERDYNIFHPTGVTVGAIAVNLHNWVFPIMNMDEAQNDPMKVILSSFSKIARDGEGASIQFVVLGDTSLDGKIKYAIGRIKQGVAIKDALNIPLSFSGDLMKTVSGFFRPAPPKKSDDEKKIDNRTLEFRDKALEMLEEKIRAPLARVNLRILASAGTRERADEILSSIEAAFNQFTRPQGNGLRFVRQTKSDIETLTHNFIFRSRDESNFLVLNTHELATLYHFPVTVSRSEAPQLKTVQAANAPAPANLPTDGTLLGFNKYRGEKRDVRLGKLDRLRHLYVIGQTGTGKSSLLKNMCIEDIKAGNGACFIDPHGSDVQDILANVPKERIEDVIYFDPSYTPRPFALNMLEYDANYPEQKIFVVNEMLSIFRKLYAAVPEAMGPAFEQYFRNATMLVMEDPETGNTLLEIPRVMADANFRNLKLSRCKNPLVVQFWRDIATKTSGEAGLANMIPYITNKFDVFLSNDIMRPIIAQEKSSFNFRDIMDNRKILLVNLAKGRLGDINANLIGLVLVGKILMAALSRVDSFGKSLPDFYLYIDEFQNITTDSISAILSEARKYGLSLNVAHQFIAQLDESISKSVFGNVGNMAVFRVGAEDAEFLESQFAPTFTAADMMKIENRNAYLKMLINGKPVPPFNIETYPPPKGNPEIVEQLKQLSYLKYGKDRKTIDDAIMAKYLSASQKPATPPAPPAPPAATPAPAASQGGAVRATGTASPRSAPQVSPIAATVDASSDSATTQAKFAAPVSPQGDSSGQMQQKNRIGYSGARFQPTPPVQTETPALSAQFSGVTSRGESFDDVVHAAVLATRSVPSPLPSLPKEVQGMAQNADNTKNILPQNIPAAPAPEISAAMQGMTPMRPPLPPPPKPAVPQKPYDDDSEDDPFGTLFALQARSDEVERSSLSTPQQTIAAPETRTNDPYRELPV